MEAVVDRSRQGFPAPTWVCPLLRGGAQTYLGTIVVADNLDEELGSCFPWLLLHRHPRSFSVIGVGGMGGWGDGPAYLSSPGELIRAHRVVDNVLFFPSSIGAQLPLGFYEEGKKQVGDSTVSASCESAWPPRHMSLARLHPYSPPFLCTFPVKFAKAPMYLIKTSHPWFGRRCTLESREMFPWF